MWISYSKGSITIEDKIIGKDIEVAKDIGILIEEPGFSPQFSGYKNLKILADINKRIDTDEIYNTMYQVGLNPQDTKKVSKYSLGMRQRLGIAQAIMEKPKIILLDEPLNGIDISGIAEMRQLLINLKNNGITVLLATHSKDDIDITCDTTCTIDSGRIINIS